MDLGPPQLKEAQGARQEARHLLTRAGQYESPLVPIFCVLDVLYVLMFVAWSSPFLDCAVFVFSLLTSGKVAFLPPRVRKQIPLVPIVLFVDIVLSVILLVKFRWLMIGSQEICHTCTF